MFKPDEIQKLKRQLKELNIDRATLEKAAQSLMNDVPELRRVLEKQSFKEGFKGRVDHLYDEVQDIFNDHEEHPDGCEKGDKSG